MTGAEIGLVLILIAVVIGAVVVTLDLSGKLFAALETLETVIGEQEQHRRDEVERAEQRAAAYIVALTEQHTEHQVALAAERKAAAEALAAEREQWSRLFFARNAVDYGTLTRVARTPDEALGEAEVHRAEALNLNRRPHIEADERGEPMIPIGMG